MDKKREEIIKAKFEKILEDKIRREEKVKELQKRQAEAEKEDYEASKDIIAYQIESMNRSMNNQLRKKKEQIVEITPILYRIRLLSRRI